MGFFQNFLNPWGSAAVKDEPTVNQIRIGFDYMGEETPTVEQFNSIFSMIDLRTNWLYRQLATLIDSTGLANNKNEISFAIFSQALRRIVAKETTRITNSTILSVDQVGMVLVDASGGAITLTLPGTNYMSQGAPEFTLVRVDNNPQNKVTILTAENRSIEGNNGQVYLATQQRMTMRAMKNGDWYVVGNYAAGSLMVGEIKDFAGQNIPAGWLPCDGRAVSRVNYSLLFSVVGFLYGEGDKSTTFNIPDRRGRVPFGSDPMVPGGSFANVIGAATNSGYQAGRRFYTLGVEQMPAHSHAAAMSEAGYHGHIANTGIGGSHGHIIGEAGFHAHTGSTDIQGNHDHSTDYGKVDANIFKNPTVAGAELSAVTWEFGRVSVNANGAHAHNLQTTGSGAHAHTISVEGSHVHQVSVELSGSHVHALTIGIAGESKPLDLMQPSIATTFIIYTGA